MPSTEAPPLPCPPPRPRRPPIPSAAALLSTEAPPPTHPQRCRHALHRGPAAHPSPAPPLPQRPPSAVICSSRLGRGPASPHPQRSAPVLRRRAASAGLHICKIASCSTLLPSSSLCGPTAAAARSAPPPQARQRHPCLLPPASATAAASSDSKERSKRKRTMVLLFPSVRLRPLATSRATAPTSSPLSTIPPRPRALPLPRSRCSGRRTPRLVAAAREDREAAAHWAELAGAVPWKAAASGALALAISFTCFVGLVNARTGVNKPELLPKEFTTVIDVAGFLSSGQENRLRQEIEDLEKDTGYKLRVLAQNYPDTPGLAIKDFWQVDDRTIVFVADPTFGNIINFNIGPLVDLEVPRSFWSQVSGKFGNMFYWKEKGEDASIEAAVTAISRCLRDPSGTNNCSEVL